MSNANMHDEAVNSNTSLPTQSHAPAEQYNSYENGPVSAYSRPEWQASVPAVPAPDSVAAPQTVPFAYNSYSSHTEPNLPVRPAQAQAFAPQPYQPQQFQQAQSAHPQAFAPQPQPYSSPARRQGRGLRTSAILLLALVLLLVFGTGAFAGWVFANGNNASSVLTTASSAPVVTSGSAEATRVAVIAKVRPAIVLINVTLASGRALGSGEIINKQGYIVTNNHVVNGANAIQVVLSDGTRAVAKLVGSDAADDLAVIKITPPTANLAVVTIGDSSQLKVGQEVLAIGNPLGNTQTVTNGIVSALNRSVSEGQGGATIPDAIQTDAPINPGNSGGALVDMQGNLVGIPTLTAIDPEFNTPANGVGFAIPANRVKLIVPQIIQTGTVTHTGRAVLGVSVASVDAAVATQYNLGVDHGVLITGLVSGGAAQKAGIKTGDVIVKVDNATINDASLLGNALLTKNPGDRVTVTVYRGGQQQTINVTLGELKAA